MEMALKVLMWLISSSYQVTRVMRHYGFPTDKKNNSQKEKISTILLFCKNIIKKGVKTLM